MDLSEFALTNGFQDYLEYEIKLEDDDNNKLDSRKRKVTMKNNDIPLKRICLNQNFTIADDSEINGNVEKQDFVKKLPKVQQIKNVPINLIQIMYYLDLSILCLFRKYKYAHKYPLLSLDFKDYNKFRIILRNETKSVLVQVENINESFVDNYINYGLLFGKVKSNFSINNYCDSYAKYLLDSLDFIEYFIVYSNSGLDVTDDNKLKKGRTRNFYPFKFETINIKNSRFLRRFLFTNGDKKGRGFYKFSQDKTTRDELLKQLEFSSGVKKLINEKNLNEREIKEDFLNKLILAVNQPSRQELNSIIKNEVEDNYMSLQKEVLRGCHNTAEIIYVLNLLIFFLHEMFSYKNIFSINFDNKTNDIIINYKNKIIYIKVLVSNNKIGFNHLFSSNKREEKRSYNNYFTNLLEKLKQDDIKYFIIYTSDDLDITEDLIFKKLPSKNFYPLKFDNVNLQKNKYNFLKNFCVNENGVLKFSKNQPTREKLLTLLKLPNSLEKSKSELKETFLNKLIFTVNQPGVKKIKKIIKSNVKSSNVPYDYQELHEIALRSLEFNKAITKELMDTLLFDIRYNKFSEARVNKCIDEEIKFAKSVVGREGTDAYNQFLNYIIQGEGLKYLEVIKESGISLSNTSSILHGAGSNASKAFEDLYNLWFDSQENQTQYLSALEENVISLANVSSILHGARANAAKAYKDLFDLFLVKTCYTKFLQEGGITIISGILSGAGVNAANAFEDLYDLWFDTEGNKLQCLKILENEGVNLSVISSILGGVGINASKYFKELYHLWFDTTGNKTQYYKILEKEGINLVSMSSILHRSRGNAVKAFKELYDLWFDASGNKTQYLKTLEEQEIRLTNISSILSGAGITAAESFKNLYHLWFNTDGNKTLYLKNLEKEGINLANMTSILGGAGSNSVQAFKDLYNLWFDTDGNKTLYLKNLEKEDIDLSNMSSILGGTGSNAAKAFQNLYELWFDSNGNKTTYLLTLEKEGINLVSLSNILHRSRGNAAKVFKELYDTLFDKQGNKSQYLITLEEEGINVANMSSILGGAGGNAAKAFKELYNTFFDTNGLKKHHLKNFIKQSDGEKNFTMHNLSSILSGAGAKAKDTFEKLYSICFDDNGNKSELLVDFYNAGFKPRNLSCILCGGGIHVASNLKKLHHMCFDNTRKKTKILNDFMDAGFRPSDFCSILSGAVDWLEKFHHFCFVGETKKYLQHFLCDHVFKPKHLGDILHGARSNISGALKDFHDICFDAAGNKSDLLVNFFKAGFIASDLSNILSLAGNNAAAILNNFHKVCFNKGNYLNHFLSEEDIFSPKDLSKILFGGGIKLCFTFKKLHDLCYDKAGNKTNYFKKLVENNPNEILRILQKNSRKKSSNFVD